MDPVLIIAILAIIVVIIMAVRLRLSSWSSHRPNQFANNRDPSDFLGYQNPILFDSRSPDDPLAPRSSPDSLRQDATDLGSTVLGSGEPSTFSHEQHHATTDLGSGSSDGGSTGGTDSGSSFDGGSCGGFDSGSSGGGFDSGGSGSSFDSGSSSGGFDSGGGSGSSDGSGGTC